MNPETESMEIDNMMKMDAVMIPYQKPEIILSEANTTFQQDCFNRKRQAVIDELRCLSTVPTIARGLNQETVYKLVCTPEGGKMYKDSAGNIKGVFYDQNGKIIEHAKFKAVGPSVVKAASAVGAQVLLISIAMQLNRLEGEIVRMRRELHNDRLAEIDAGVQLYGQAMFMESVVARNQMLANAVQSLGKGLSSTMRALKMQIAEMPSANIGFFDNWGKSKTQIAAEKLSLAHESFQSCVLGIQTMSECYAAWNEPRAASVALLDNLSRLKTCGIETAAKKARLIEPVSNDFPERPWLSFLEMESQVAEQVSGCGRLADERFARIEIKLKPEELMVA